MKKQHNFKMPEWAMNRIKAIAAAYEITMTEALLRCLDQGSKWHRRHIQKEINAGFDFTVEPKPAVVLYDTTTNQEIMRSEEPWEDIERTIEVAKRKWMDED